MSERRLEVIGLTPISSRHGRWDDECVILSGAGSVAAVADRNRFETDRRVAQRALAATTTSEVIQLRSDTQ